MMSDSTMNEFLLRLLVDGIWVLPFLCIWGVGLGFCIHFRANNKMAADLCLAAFCIFILNMIASLVMRTWYSFHNEWNSMVSMSSIYSMISAITTLFSIAGWIFLIVAMYKLLQPKTENGSSPPH